MKTKKMPANCEYLSWDPENLEQYDQWVDLELELKRAGWIRPQPKGNLARAIDSIRNKLNLRGNRF